MPLFASKPMKKAKQKRLTRLQVMLSADELTALDNFRFEKRMPSLAAAIREILRRGLSGNGFDLAGKGLRSSEFGVLENDGRISSPPIATRAPTDRRKPSGETVEPATADRAKGNAGGKRTQCLVENQPERLAGAISIHGELLNESHGFHKEPKGG